MDNKKWPVLFWENYVTPSMSIIFPLRVAMISQVRQSDMVRVRCTTNVAGPFLAKKKKEFAMSAKAWYHTPLGPVVLSIRIGWATKGGQSFFGKTMSL